jgi:hypothetical protein
VAEQEKLKLGKGVALVKTRLKRLPQCDETWEADFQALPKPIMQTETHYLGIVVTKNGGSLLSDMQVHGGSSVKSSGSRNRASSLTHRRLGTSTQVTPPSHVLHSRLV